MKEKEITIENIQRKECPICKGWLDWLDDDTILRVPEDEDVKPYFLLEPQCVDCKSVWIVQVDLDVTDQIPGTVLKPAPPTEENRRDFLTRTDDGWDRSFEKQAPPTEEN